VPQTVDLYGSAYENYESETYREIRTETYGAGFGQTSWVTTDESEEIPRLLGLNPDSYVLEIGCGSGGYALHLAETVGCRIYSQPITCGERLFVAAVVGERAKVCVHDH
jgi:protein-L-isoaspartate O-methyltransferase